MQTIAQRNKLFLYSALGTALWLNAVIAIRIFNAFGLLDGPYILIGFAVSIPLAFITVWLFLVIAKTPWPDMSFAITWGTAVAMLLDGVALGLFHTLYGTSVDHGRIAGSVILFGAAVGIFVSMWYSARRR